MGYAGPAAAPLLLLLVLALIAGCDDRGEPDTPAQGTSTPAPAQQPASEATPTATPPAAPDAVPFKVTNLAPFPSDLVVLYTRLRGIDRRDGLYRVYRDNSGALRNEQLFVTTDVILWFAAKDVGTIAAALCRPKPADCGKQHSAGPPPPTTSSVILSEDGGVTWRAIASFDDTLPQLTWHGDSLVISAFNRRSHDRQHVVYPAGTLISPPATAHQDGGPEIVGGQLVWRTRDGLGFVDGAGRPVPSPLPAGLRRAPPDPAGRPFEQVITVGSATLAVWREVLFANEGYSVVLPSPGQIYELTGFMSVVDWDGGTIAYANVRFEPQRSVNVHDRPELTNRDLQALIDFTTGTITPFAEPFLPGQPGEAFSMLAAARGPVLRVHGAGDCLNVRTDSSIGAPIVGCFADGVLLRDLGATVVAAVSWAHVETPTGKQGWASLEFLQR